MRKLHPLNNSLDEQHIIIRYQKRAAYPPELLSPDFRNRHVVKQSIRKERRRITITLTVDHHLKHRLARWWLRDVGHELTIAAIGVVGIGRESAVGGVFARLLCRHQDGVAEVDGDGGIEDASTGIANESTERVLAGRAEAQRLRESCRAGQAILIVAPDVPIQRERSAGRFIDHPRSQRGYTKIQVRCVHRLARNNLSPLCRSLATVCRLHCVCCPGSWDLGSLRIQDPGRPGSEH